MREIKFRAWDWERIMHLDNYDFVDFDRNIFINTNQVWYGQYEYQHIMQYTGLKDKNGKEIYEGDIVYDNGWEKREICWDERWAAFVQKQWRTFDSLEMKYINEEYESIWSINRASNTYYDWEVIWNIYENPELLD